VACHELFICTKSSIYSLAATLQGIVNLSSVFLGNQNVTSARYQGCTSQL
jgi:hypothetical protein